MKDPNLDADLTRDLQEFLDSTTGPYLSIVLPARSDVAHPAARLDTAWQRIRGDYVDRWPHAELEQVDEMLASAGHEGGDSIALIVPTTGTPLIEHLAGSPEKPRAMQGPVPAFTPIIEHRQRTIAHLVVDCDKAGADIIAFDGGETLATDHVDGDELHIHRGHPGGWSQRRFQQRAENTWESNIGDVADATERLATDVGAQLIAVAGPTRAQSMLVRELGERSLGDITTALDAGSPDGIADEVVTLTDDVHARAIAQISKDFRERCAEDTATADPTRVLDALDAGRVETLLVSDDWSDTTTLGRSLADLPETSRMIDAAIAATLRSGGAVVVVPQLAALDVAIGAFLRW